MAASHSRARAFRAEAGKSSHASKRRRRAGRNEDQFPLADILENMRLAAVERVNVAGAQFETPATDFKPEPSFDDDASLFALVLKRVPPRSGAGPVALVQHLQAA